MATATALNPISDDSPKALFAPGKSSSHDGLYAVAVVCVTALGAALRFHALTAKSFWLDEGFSIDLARLPWLRFLHALWSGEANMALYYALLHVWLGMGNSEAFIRGLSVLFSVATIPAVFFLGARLFARRAGLLGASLLAINAYHIRYAQETRCYAMLIFFAVLATWLLARNLQQPSSAHWHVYAILCALTTYSHFFGVLLVPAHAISLLSWRRDAIPWRKIVSSAVLFGVLTAPIAIFVFAIYVLKTGAPPSLWFPPLEPDSLLILGADFSGAYGRILVTLDVVAIGLAALGAARVRNAGIQTSAAWAYALLFSWLVTPVVMVLTVSLLKPLFIPRFLIYCLPAFLLLVGVGISRLRPPALCWALFLAISVCSILGDLRYYRDDFEMRRQDWRGVTSYVLDHSQAGDSVFFCEPAGESPFNYYTWIRKSAASRPVTLNVASLSDRKDEYQSELNPEDVVHIPGTNYRAAPPMGNRVWLVLMYLDGSMDEQKKGKAVAEWLSNGRRQIDEQDFTVLKVKLFGREPGNLQSVGDRDSLKP